MEKSTFTPLYRLLRERLVRLRKEAGLTQRALAARLGREHSFVGRVEQGERRVDLIEFYWICNACRTNPLKVVRDLLRAFRQSESTGGRARRN